MLIEDLFEDSTFDLELEKIKELTNRSIEQFGTQSTASDGLTDEEAFQKFLNITNQ